MGVGVGVGDGVGVGVMVGSGVGEASVASAAGCCVASAAAGGSPVVAPGGMHVRVDSGLYAGYKVPPYYDSMIGKLIVYGTTRERCIMRLKRALEEFVVDGMKTTVPLHQAIIEDPAFLDGEYTIKWLERWLDEQEPQA